MKELYKKQLNDKIVFFDFDGVLSVYQSTESCVHIDDKEYIRKHIMEDSRGVYRYSRAPEVMKEIINSLDGYNIWCITQVESIYEYRNKVEFIKENYPNMRVENILFVARSENKVDLIEGLYELYYKHFYNKDDIVLIDDTLDVIKSVECKGYRCYHISNFL